MISKNWLRPLTVVALAGAMAGCDEGLTEVNENPNSPEVVPVQAVLSSAIWDLVASNGGYGVFGEWTTLYHLNTWAQHTAQSAYNDEDNYTPRSGIDENIWASMYAGVLTDLQNANEIAEANSDENLAAVTEILSVYAFLFLADTYGDIPYAEALNLEEYPQPAFSAQSEIYPDLLARLEAAAAQITPGGSPSWASGDLIYGGDMDRWQEFANSLRLRIAMRTSATSFATTARAEFAEAWSANRFDAVADQADLDWTGTLPSQNPLYEQIVLGGRTADFRVSATLINLLQSTNDPRLAVFAEPAVSDGVYRGLTNGALPTEVGLTINDLSTIGAAFIAADAPSVLMSYAEVLFLGAEAAQRGWITGSASTLCEQGIRASMEQYGIGAAAIAAYLAANPCSGLTDILTEKFKALYLLGPESYADVRRTGIPNLPLPVNAVLPTLPARLGYPDNEALYNQNAAAYVATPLTTKMWWMP